MLNAFLLLIGFQLAGEATAQFAGLPVPGMILGLVALLGLLALRGRLLGPERAIPPGLDAVARGLHGHLGLLFVPAGVGVLAQRDLIASEGVAILGAVVVSTVVAVGIAGRLALGRSGAAAPHGVAPAR